MPPFSCTPLGEQALLIQFEQKIDAAVLRHIMAMEQLIQTHLPKGIRELIPAYASLAVLFEDEHWTYRKLAEAMLDLGKLIPKAIRHLPKGRTHEIPVQYGGRNGPDLTTVAQKLKLTEDEIVERHIRRTYLVYMLGFLPGFVYLGKPDPALHLPRREKPRLKVPAGSIAIAAEQTGIYTLESPGGWHIIGRTTQNLFNRPQASNKKKKPEEPENRSPSLLRRGDWVKFVALSQATT